MVGVVPAKEQGENPREGEPAFRIVHARRSSHAIP